MAFDSAGAVYRHALKMRGKDVSNVKDDSALVHILDAMALPGSPEGQRETTIAMDAAASADFDKRFPNVARIGHA